MKGMNERHELTGPKKTRTPISLWLAYVVCYETLKCYETPRTGRLNKLGSDAMFFLSIDDDNFGIPVLNNASGEQSAMLGNICERYGNKFDL